MDSIEVMGVEIEVMGVRGVLQSHRGPTLAAEAEEWSSYISEQVCRPPDGTAEQRRPTPPRDQACDLGTPMPCSTRNTLPRSPDTC